MATPRVLTGDTPPGKRHGAAEDLIVYRRRGIVAAMKRAGATYQQIVDTAVFPTGERCFPPGTNKAAAYMDVKRGLEEATKTMSLELGELRELESQRLDDYLLRLHPGVQVGDPKAINAAIRCTEVRARLYGLNEPDRLEVITVDALDAAARELEREIARRADRDARSGQPSA